MVCIYCTSETEVFNSRPQKRSNQTWRRRRCLRCQAAFTTLESVDYTNVLRVQAQGVYRPFLSDLLYTEVLLALSDRKNAYMEARELTNTIIKNLMQLPSHPLFRPSDISLAAATVLERFDKRAWHRFAAEHPSVAS
jgi:transcriptional regulator NrdR family protein